MKNFWNENAAAFFLSVMCFFAPAFAQTWNSAAPPDISGSQSATVTIAAGAQGVLNVAPNATINIVSSNNNALVNNGARFITLNIGANATVNWSAKLSAQDTEGATGAILRVQGAGNLRLLSSASLSNTASNVNNPADMSALVNLGTTTIDVEGATISSAGNIGIHNRSTGIINVKSGTLETRETSYPIRNFGQGTINVSGGTVRGAAWGIMNVSQGGPGGTVNISGGSIINATSTSAGIANMGAGTVNITGGSITTSGSIAVANSFSGTVKISGANTRISSAHTDATQGTIFNSSTMATAQGIVEISGGLVENTAAGGRAITNNNTGTINISGGTVRATQANGRAIHNQAAGTINITGGTVSAATATGRAIHNEANGRINISQEDPAISTLVTSAATGNSGTVFLNANGGALQINCANVVNSAGGNIIFKNNNNNSAILLSPATLTSDETEDLSWIYDGEERSVSASATNCIPGASVLLKLYRNGTQAASFSSAFTHSFRNVAESGTYQVRSVTAFAGFSSAETVLDEFVVNIIAREINLNGAVRAIDREYDGTKIVELACDGCSFDINDDGFLAGEDIGDVEILAGNGEMENPDVGENKPVVKTNITLTGSAAASNYRLVTPNEITVNISKKAIDRPRLLSDNLVFNESAQTANIGNAARTGYTITGDRQTNAGEYTAQISLDGNHVWAGENGQIDTEDVFIVWNIAKRPIYVRTPTSSEFTYTGGAHTLQFSATPTGTRGYTITGDRATDAGEYTAVLTLDGNNIWRISSSERSEEPLSYNWKIVKGTIVKPVLVSGSFVYNGAPQSALTTNPVPQTSAYAISGRTETNAGTHEARFTLINPNYRWQNANDPDDTDDVVLVWNIARRGIDKPQFDLPPTFVYTGEEQVLQIEDALGYTVFGNRQKDAGKHSFCVSLDANHRWINPENASDTEDLCFDWEIAKARTITIKADDKSILRGEAEPQYTFTATGFLGDDTQDLVLGVSFEISPAFNSSREADFTIRPMGASAQNYEIAAYETGTLRVLPNTAHARLVAQAKAAIEKTHFADVLQADINTQPLARAHVLSILNVISEISSMDNWQIASEQFQAAIAGDTGNAAGKNGFYKFKVFLRKGAIEDETVLIALNIIATPFIMPVVPKIDDTSVRDRESAALPRRLFVQNIVSERLEILLDDGEILQRFAVLDVLGNVVASGENNTGDRDGRPYNAADRGATVNRRTAAVWDLRNSAGRFVANGSYLVIVETMDRDGKAKRYSGKLGVSRR